jgi:hypothetical protein
VKAWGRPSFINCSGIFEESHAGKEFNVSGIQKENVASCIVAGRDGLTVWGVGDDQAPTPDDSAELMVTSDAKVRGG